jgi:hypothetical protein
MPLKSKCIKTASAMDEENKKDWEKVKSSCDKNYRISEALFACTTVRMRDVLETVNLKFITEWKLLCYKNNILLLNLIISP